MARKITVVVSQGQSAHPDKRKLEESLVGALLMEAGVEVNVIPNLYDLHPDSTALLCLQGVTGDVVVLSWLFARAAHWTLDRHGIKGRFGETLLKADDDAEDEDEDSADDEMGEAGRTPVGPRDVPSRTIYHLDLKLQSSPEPYLEEIRRIAAESTVQTVDLMGWIEGAPSAEQMARYLEPGKQANGGPLQLAPGDAHSAAASGDAAAATSTGAPVEETPGRRWYPVIDYSRCTNCMECIDFCLFGVYGVDRAETILVEQPDNCRKGCPACSRVCPENAIIFPQHKTPAIAGSPDASPGGLKIDLSQLFGAPNAIEIAAQERDVELVAVGRDAVGLSVGIPKRQAGREHSPNDDLDDLIDQLDDLAL